MFRPLLFSGLLSTAMVAGCATYEAKPLAPEATRTQLEARRLDDEKLRQFITTHGQASGADWDLSRLTLAALYFNPMLDVARAQWREAEAEVQAAAARPNPSFSFSPTHIPSAAAGTTPWILGYALDVPLETMGKRTYHTVEARRRAEAARFRVAESAWAVRSAVRRALIDLQAAEGAAEVWRSQKPLLADAARLVDAQVQAGDASSLLAAQARITLHRAELAGKESERAVTFARSQLAQAIGVPAAAMAEVRVSYHKLVDASESVQPADARVWAAQNRADLLAELAAYAATEAALQGEIARQYPDITFKPGYELDQGTGKWSLGVGFTLPFLHQNQGPIAVAKARREVAAARFLVLQNRVLAEVDRAAADYTSTLSELETVASLRSNLERQAKTVKAQQEAGETSRLELVRAQIELADIQRADLDARVRVARAASAFEDAVQRPLAGAETAWSTIAAQPSR